MSEEREEDRKVNMEEPGQPADLVQEGKEQYSFLQETFKDEQVTGKTIWGSVCRTAGRGLIFGLAACLAFYALKPWADSRFSGSDGTVTIPKDEEEEVPPEDQEKEAGEEQVVLPELTVENYREMSRALYQVAAQASKCVVEVGAVRDEESWENTEFDLVNSVSGLIIWENAAEVLILAPSRITRDAKSLNVTFVDNMKYSAVLKKQDLNHGLAVFSVNRRLISDSTKNQIEPAALGNSNRVNRGEPVIVQGKQFGYAGGVGYGIISSVRNKMATADGSYKILTTDIAAADNGSGVLFNTDGEVVGIVDQKITDQGSMELVTAYAISDIKEYIELLSNGKGVPYLGINGVDVTESTSKEQGIPEGIYVKEVEVDSPAMKAGIQSGDVITEFNGVMISTMVGLKNKLMEYQVGDEIKIRGQRLGAANYVEVGFSLTVGSKE